MNPDGKGDGEELIGLEGGEIVIRIYHMTKKNLISIKGKKICQNSKE